MSTSTFETFDNSSCTIGAPDICVESVVSGAYGTEPLPSGSHSRTETLPVLKLANARQSDTQPEIVEVDDNRRERTAILNQINRLVDAGRFLQENGSISNAGLNLMQQFMERSPRRLSYESAAVELQTYLNRTVFTRGNISPFTNDGSPPGIRLTFERMRGESISPAGEAGGRIQQRPHMVSVQTGEVTQSVPVRIFSSSWQIGPR